MVDYPSDSFFALQNVFILLNEDNELHNREMHISGKFLLGHDEPVNDPINDPLNQISLDERAKQVLDLLRKNPGITRSKMAELMGCSDSTVKRKLAEMADRDIVPLMGDSTIRVSKENGEIL